MGSEMIIGLVIVAAFLVGYAVGRLKDGSAEVILHNVDLIKTNQLNGSWVGIILKFMLKKPLIIRTGYNLYEFSKNDLNVTARISIFNINGRLLQRKALAAKKGVNRGKFIWDAGKRSSGSGVFFAVLETGETRVVRKMVLLH